MVIARRLLIVLEIIVGIAAVFGGAILVDDTTGSTLHFPIEWLQRSPFTNYFWPGVVLVLLGVLHFVAAYSTFRQHISYVVLSSAAGLLLVCWIGAQVIFIGPQAIAIRPAGAQQFIAALVGCLIYTLAIELWREGQGPHSSVRPW